MLRIIPTMTLIAILLLSNVTACRRTPEDKTTKGPDVTATADISSNEPVPVPPATPQAPEPPPKPTMPEVKLTETLEATCLVKVGDPLPEGKLAGRDGPVVDVHATFGPKLTVFCFWNGDNIYAMEELQQLEKHVAGPYGDRGVRVVAVNEKDPPKVVAEKLQMAGATFLCLLDPDGSYFAKLATEGLPRTYLVDDQGKILWFDTEYSLSTRRDLTQAIDYMLAQ